MKQLSGNSLQSETNAELDSALDTILGSDFGKVTAPTIRDAVQSGPWSRELVKAIAMDIGKEVVAYVEVMYPKAVEATSSTFRLSLRNRIYNEIMAAIEVNEEGQIIARMKDRKKFRRWWTAQYRKIRKAHPPLAGMQREAADKGRRR